MTVDMVSEHPHGQGMSIRFEHLVIQCVADSYIAVLMGASVAYICAICTPSS